MILLEISKLRYTVQVGRMPSGKYFCSYGRSTDDEVDLEESWHNTYEEALEDALFVISEWENYRFTVRGTVEERIKGNG
jgi:DNA gyrase inhibitor GyrI